MRFWMTVCGIMTGHFWSDVRDDGHERWQVCQHCLHRRDLP
jgi:hypothetical protein